MHQAYTRPRGGIVSVGNNNKKPIFVRTIVREPVASRPSSLSALDEGTDLQSAFEQRSRPLSRERRAQRSRRATVSMTTNPSDHFANDWPVRK